MMPSMLRTQPKALHPGTPSVHCSKRKGHVLNSTCFSDFQQKNLQLFKTQQNTGAARSPVDARLQRPFCFEASSNDVDPSAFAANLDPSVRASSMAEFISASAFG
jgi:hypothetical protein